VTDLNGRITSVSNGTGELLAIDDRWLTGKPLAAFVVDDERRGFRAMLLELGRGRGPVGTSLRLQRRDGLQVEVDVEAVVDPGADQLEWLLASDRLDLTVDADERPVLLGRPVQQLLARLPIGVVSFGEDLVIDYVNPAARLILGGQCSPGSLLPDAMPGFPLRKFAMRLLSATPPGRTVVETARGRLVELEGVHGDHENGLLLLHDVTAEERRRRAEQEFVTNAAHELRTPIAAIASALEVLENGAHEVPADRDLFLGHIKTETDRLARLVAAMLLLARIQTGQETPSLELVEVAPLLADVAESLEPKQDVSVHVACDSRVAALADPELLRQAVWNVAVNATRHTARGEVCLEARDLGRVSEIEVRDTGSGMSAETQAQVQNRFFRAQRRSGNGFGLGLPISIAITNALGGRLSIESELDVGTRVRLHLPSARLVA
jgi:signal transduction histidine kinase